ncbi:MAG: hypothetical protein R3B70_09890 [Polyangiaceae bacterium]
MKKLLIGGAVGFAAGWIARATVDSGREILVAAGAAAYGAAEEARRLWGFEREYFEDLVAEARARWESAKKRRTEGPAKEPAKGPAKGPGEGPAKGPGKGIDT